MTEIPCYIYVLTDEQSGFPVYVGATDDPTKRYDGHRWARAKGGKNVGMVIVEKVVDPYKAGDVELEWISYFEFIGAKLENKSRRSYSYHGLDAVKRFNWRRSAGFHGTTFSINSIIF